MHTHLTVLCLLLLTLLLCQRVPYRATAFVLCCNGPKTGLCILLLRCLGKVTAVLSLGLLAAKPTCERTPHIGRT